MHTGFDKVLVLGCCCLGCSPCLPQHVHQFGCGLPESLFPCWSLCLSGVLSVHVSLVRVGPSRRQPKANLVESLKPKEKYAKVPACLVFGQLHVCVFSSPHLFVNLQQIEPWLVETVFFLGEGYCLLIH